MGCSFRTGFTDTQMKYLVTIWIDGLSFFELLICLCSSEFIVSVNKDMFELQSTNQKNSPSNLWTKLTDHLIFSH